MRPALKQDFFHRRHAALEIFVILLLCTCSALPAQLPDVRITFKCINRPLGEVLDSVSVQAGYYFTFNADLLPVKSRVSATFKNLPLKATLDTLLNDTTLRYLQVDKNIVIYRKNLRGIRPFVGEALPDPLVKIRGQILDGRTGKPLPYATIALYGTNKGTISNESGIFSLSLPADLTDPLLVISFIGYQNQYIPVTLPEKEDLIIRLSKEFISLQEVIIRYKDPASLLDEALRRIPENYLDDYSLMTAYYRENVRRNNKFLLFDEAVIDILKEPYNLTSGDEKVRIIMGRKFVNFNEEDTVFMKIKSGIRSSLELDIVKNLPYFLTSENRNLFDFEFADIVSYKNQLVYVIRFRQKPGIKEDLFTGEIYIDMQSLAILAADFQLDPRYISQATGTFVIRKSPKLKIRPVSAVYHTDYRQSEGRYHLSQVRGEVRFRMRKQRKWIASQYSLNIEMAVTDVQIGTRQKFRNNETINTGVILSDRKFTPERQFWGGYTTIEPEASLTQVLKKMGKEVS